MSGVYLIHGVGLPSWPLELTEWERRETLAAPPAALRYRVFEQDSSTLVASALGGLVVIQRVGDAASKREAIAYYEDDVQFDPWYQAAVACVDRFVGRPVAELSFSFVWHEADGDPEIGWRYVKLPGRDRSILLEATLVWCLAEVVDAAIRQLPLLRSAGRVDRAFVAHALDLFSLGRPAHVWTSQFEIETAELLYRGWRLGERIDDSRSRFDQAASSFAFFWEAAERRRETTLALALAVVAVVGLLQADQQLSRVTGMSVETVDWAIVMLAVVLVIATLWRAAISPHLADAAARRRWRELASRMKQ